MVLNRTGRRLGRLARHVLPPPTTSKVRRRPLSRKKKKSQNRALAWLAVSVLLFVLVGYALYADKTKNRFKRRSGFLTDVTFPNSYDPVKARLQVLTKARSLLGIPYVWGGEGSQGLDCSGLVKLAYKSAGIGLPHKSNVLARLGKPVDFTALQLADLVFFHSNDDLSGHVGIYVGKGRMIHASAKHRKVVLESLTEVAKYAGLTRARRIIVPAAGGGKPPTNGREVERDGSDFY